MKTILIKPVVTEKATQLEKARKYSFFVHQHATKIEVRKAFEESYGVAVTAVAMINQERKTKLGKLRRPVTKRHAYKKAIISVKSTKDVNLLKPRLKK